MRVLPEVTSNSVDLGRPLSSEDVKADTTVPGSLASTLVGATSQDQATGVNLDTTSMQASDVSRLGQDEGTASVKPASESEGMDIEES